MNALHPDAAVGQGVAPLTALVATLNESRRLKSCLESLAFCDQRLVVDLGSRDACVSIARQCGAEVVHHARVPVVEMLWPDAVKLARNDWIIRTDPDEVIPASLASDIVARIRADDGRLGMIGLGHQYYFCGEKITTTVWGGVKYVPRVFHKARVELTGTVHRGIRLREGFLCEDIPARGDNLVRHYWIDSMEQFFQKHLRYIRHEGKSRYDAGERFSWPNWARRSMGALTRNLFTYNGWRGGTTGATLSLLNAWYECMSILQVGQYQRKVNRARRGGGQP